MKQFLRHIFLLVALFVATANVWAADCTYEYNRTVYNTGIKNSGDIIAQFEFANVYGLSSISYKLTLQCSAAGKDLQYKVQYLPSNSSTWTDTNISTSTLDGTWQAWRSESSESKTEAISSSSSMFNARGIRIVSNTKFGSKRTVSVDEVKFVMAKTLSGSEETMSFADQVYNTTSSAQTRTFTFSNVATGKSISITNNTNAAEFPAEITKEGDCTGSVSVSVKFKPSQKGTRTGQITISGDCGSKTFTVTGNGLLATPTLTLKGTTGLVDRTTDVAKPNYIDLSVFFDTYIGDGYKYEVVSSNSQYAHFDGDNFYATEQGAYTIHITSPAGDHYSDTFADGKKYREIVITVRDKARPVYKANYTQSSADGMLVDGIIENAFTLTNVSKDAYFACNISVTSISNVNDGSGKVISYDIVNNKIIAHNAGTATLQFVQTENSDYYGAESQIYTFTVSKYQTSFSGEAYSMMVEGMQIANYSYSNTSAAQPTALSADDFYYTIDNVVFANEELNKGTDLITFNPSTKQITACNAGTAKITLHQKETYKYTGATASYNVTVNKHTPVFTLNPAVTNSPEKLYFNKEYPNYFTTNANSPLTITSSDELVAKWVPGSNAQSYTLQTFSKTNTATLTAIQHENYYWQRWEGSIDIQLQDPNNHVPFTIDNSDEMWSVFYNHHNKDLEWDGNIKFVNRDDIGFDWEDNYLIIHFTGVPHELSFYTTTDDAATTGTNSNLYFYVAAGEQSNNLTEIWSSTKKNNGNADQKITLTLNDKVQYVKLCYTGNLDGWFHNVTVTELNQFEAIDANKNLLTAINFGNALAVGVNHNQTFSFRYANAGHKVKFEIVSDTPENTATAKKYLSFLHNDFVTLDGEKYLTSIGGENVGTVQNITVQFYSEKNDYTIPANTKIKISDEVGHTYYIPVSGYIERATQTLSWQGRFLKDPVILPLTTGTFTGVAISSNPDLPITYTSSNPDVIAVSADGKSLTSKAEGEVYITANQVGDDKYKPAEPITKAVIVTGKKVQVIIWESNLTDLVVGDAPVTLSAKVYWIDMDNGAQGVYSEEQTQELQFTSADPSIVSIEGNILTIHNVGETTVTAYVPGDDTYKEDQQVIPVRVRPTIVGCEDVLLLDHPDEFEFYKFDLSTPEVISPTYEIDHSKGVPGTLEFQHTGKPWTFAIEYYEGTIHAQQSIDGSTWTTVASVTPTKNTTNISEGSPLDRQAKYIRFVRAQGGIGYHYVSNIKVHPAQYIEPSQEVIDFSTVQYGSKNTFTFDVAYSNIKYQLSPKTSASDVQVSPQSFGDCGAFGTQTITGTWTPNEGGDNITRTITFTDVNTGMSATVTLKANVLKKDQQIEWPDAPTSIDEYTDIDSRPLKTLNASREEVRDITYEIVSGTELAAFDNGMFYIKGTGDICIRAYHNGDAEYKPVSASYNIHITSMSPTFVGTNSQSWTTTENWVDGIKPTTSDDFAVILAPVTIAEEVSANGLQIASAGAIHITAKGGLTVGERGVVNSTDDTKISIDNNLDGAGFLRINPQANDIPNQVTVNYTTRTYDNGSPRNEVWQYLGMPGANGQISTLEGVSMYHWKEASGWIQKSAADLQNIPAWDGYAFTQSKEEDATFQINVEPILENKEIHFTCTPKGMKGDNLFVNSYLAPIDVRKIDEKDIVDPNNILVRTFFIFNSGSWNDWNAGAGDITAASGYDKSSPGHYYSIPFYSAELIDDGTTQVVIPSMQGVYVYSAGESSIKLDYNKHVLAANAKNMHNPMRAPQHQMEDESFRRVRIQASSENSGADRMYIVQEKNTTPGYDNGYDGDNINASGQVNIYVHEPFGPLEVACSNHIDSTWIGFTAGADTTYTLTFGAVVGEDMYLVDNLTDSLMHLSDGKQYTFYAQPNSVDDMRFRLVVIPNPEDDDSTNNDGETSDVDNISSSVNLWIHDNIVYVLDAPHNSSLSIYSVSGMCIQAPHTIHHSPCTIDLSHLPTGVYVLRLNDKAFKIVCD